MCSFCILRILCRSWEQRELKEILKVNSGRDYKHLGSGSVPVYGTGGYMLSVNDKLSDKDAIGIGRKGTIDKPQYLKAPFWTVDTLFFMIPLNNFDLQFLYTMTQKINWKRMDESTGVPSLSKAVIEKVNQNIPSYQEQIKIGGFFKQLDNTIALHLCKQRQLNLLKQSLMKEILPQSDSVLPHLRLANFRDPWEQHQLKEVLKVNSGRDYKHLDEGNIPVYGTGGYMLSVDGKLSDVDCIGLGRKGTIDKPQYLQAPFWTVDTLFYLTPFPNYDIYFLYTLIQSINWKSMDESTGVPSLSKSVIERVTRTFPILEEQRKIGFVFKQLDDTIALHQQKVAHLKTLKGTLLNKMFI
jgi:type I restriction enzyme S subunit